MLYKVNSLCVFAVIRFFALWSNLFSLLSFFSPHNKLSSFTQNVKAKLFINRINMDFSNNKLCGVTTKCSAPSQLKFTVQHQACEWFGRCFLQHTAQEIFKAELSEISPLGWSSTIWGFLYLILKQDWEHFLCCFGLPPTVLQQIRMLRKASGRADWLCFLALLNSLTFKQI